MGELGMLVAVDLPAVEPVLRQDLWLLFRRVADAGATLVVSSHVMDEAMRCDRLLLMREGDIVADTTPRGLLADTGEDNPDDAFLALVRREGSR